MQVNPVTMRDIARAAGTSVTTVSEPTQTRIIGLADTAHGLPCERLVSASPAPEQMRAGAGAMTRLLDSHSDTGAVVGAADMTRLVP